MDIWEELYAAARAVQRGREISPFMEAGGVAAAIRTKAGNTYVGVCIDTASSLGMCAERSAMANMITRGESRIDKVVAVMSDGKVGPPCGACRQCYKIRNHCHPDVIDLPWDLSVEDLRRELADIAPTMLSSMGIEIPKEMTGKSLIE